jgi:hypothetical protein
LCTLPFSLNCPSLIAPSSCVRNNKRTISRHCRSPSQHWTCLLFIKHL